MKKFQLLFCLFIALLLGACSDDSNDAEPDKTNNLIGKWDMTSFTYDATSEVNVEGVSNKTTSVAVAKEIDFIMEFKESPQVVGSEGSYLLELTSEFNGMEFTQTQTSNNFFGSANWELDGDNLILSSGEQEINGKILELTDKYLKFEFKFDRETTIEGYTTVQKLNGLMEAKRD